MWLSYAGFGVLTWWWWRVLSSSSPLNVIWCFRGTCHLHSHGRRIGQARNLHEAVSEQSYVTVTEFLDFWTLEFHVFGHHKKPLKGHGFGLDSGGAVVPEAAQGVLCRENTPAVVSVGCLPHCPWGPFSMASILLTKTVPRWVAFEQPS
jgi:hypothetical protein